MQKDCYTPKIDQSRYPCACKVSEHCDCTLDLSYQAPTTRTPAGPKPLGDPKPIVQKTSSSQPPGGTQHPHPRGSALEGPNTHTPGEGTNLEGPNTHTPGGPNPEGLNTHTKICQSRSLSVHPGYTRTGSCEHELNCAHIQKRAAETSRFSTEKKKKNTGNTKKTRRTFAFYCHDVNELHGRVHLRNGHFFQAGFTLEAL